MSAARRVAVVVDGPATPAWQARAVDALKDASELEVVELRRLASRGPALARRVHAAGERHFFGIGPDAQAPVEVQPLPAQSPSGALTVWLAESQPPADEPQELLYLRHAGIVEPLEDAFRRALLGGEPCVSSEAVLRSRAGEVVVARTTSAVGPASELISRSLALWKLAAMVARAAARLPGLEEPAAPAPKASRAPAMARLLVRDAVSWVRAPATRLLFRRQWQICVRERSGSPTRGWEREHGLVRWGDARLYADPFLFEHEGRHHLFCEEVPHGWKRGVISHTELQPDGRPASAPRPALIAPYHLSYPCVFEHEGEVFMIPETCAAGRIELYRAAPFPRSWERCATLVDDVRAADATLLRRDGQLWLFVAIAVEGASYSDELHIFFADELTGPWRPHPRNPVVSDVRAARPAGAIQNWSGRLVRPAQDCSRRYGWALSFRQIDALSESEYAEHEIERLEPADLDDARATHTYAADARYEAIDLRRRELRLG